MAFVTPDNARFAFDVKIKSDTTHKAETGQYVVVRITRYPAKNIPAMGEVIEVLGDFLAPGVEIDVALRRWDIPCSWSEALIKQKMPEILMMRCIVSRQKPVGYYGWRLLMYRTMLSRVQS